VVGVFLSADQVQGNMQGMNPYGYVGGNPEMFVDPTGHDNDPWLVYVAAWYRSTQAIQSNISYGALTRITIPNAKVPNRSIDEWPQFYGTGDPKTPGYGVPDISNQNTGVIWEVKTGGGTGENMGLYLPAADTVRRGIAQAMWYAERARATNWFRRSDWQVGSAQSDPRLVQTVQACPGQVCIVAFQDGTVLAIRNPADGLLTYGVLHNRTSQRVNTTLLQLSTAQTETYQQQYNRFTRLSEINTPTDSWDSSDSSTGVSSIDDMFNDPGWVTYKPSSNSGSGGPPESFPVGSGGGCGEAGCL